MRLLEKLYYVKYMNVIYECMKGLNCSCCMGIRFDGKEFGF